MTNTIVLKIHATFYLLTCILAASGRENSPDQQTYRAFGLKKANLSKQLDVANEPPPYIPTTTLLF